MGRILAIDYGSKRTGIAVTDELQLIASGLTTVETHGLMPFLSHYFSEQKVETIVIGEPTQRDGTPSNIEGNIQNFIKGFGVKFPSITIVRVDVVINIFHIFSNNPFGAQQKGDYLTSDLSLKFRAGYIHGYLVMPCGV